MKSRSLGHNYPQWFEDLDDHDHQSWHDDGDNVNREPTLNIPTVVRGRRSLPSYCTAVPVFISPTPKDGIEIDGSSGFVSFTLRAESQNGHITLFSYQPPLGMICTEVDENGQITCTWALTPEQILVEQHAFCYDATDNFGLLTERRCLFIIGSGEPPTTTTTTTATSTTTTTSTTTSTTTAVQTTTTTIKNMKNIDIVFV